LIEILGALGLLAFAVSSVSVGVRCTLRGLKTGAAPELSVGIGFLVGVLVGYLPESVVTSTELFSAEASKTILMVTQIAIRVAAICVMVFTVSVFNRRRPLGMGLCVGILAALVASWIAFPHYVTYADGPDDLFWYEVFSIARSVAVAWGAAESLAYYRKCVRRRSIGLADPMVTNRFLLWGIGLVSLTGLMASTTLAKLAGIDPTAYGWVLLESTLGLIGAVSLWLAFFPADAFRRLIERSHDLREAA